MNMTAKFIKNSCLFQRSLAKVSPLRRLLCIFFYFSLGTRQGDHGNYTQGATFENNEFKGRTDVTAHGRNDHHNPHYHKATGPNSANSKGEPINDFFWEGF